MKHLKYFTLNICIFSLFSIYSSGQINQLNHKKYWYYRKRLVNEFLVSGEENIFFEKKPKQPKPPGAEEDDRRYLAGCGLSIPARDIVDRDGGKKQLNFAESPVSLGYYIAVLATELRLLYNYGQPYENTKTKYY